MEVAEPEMNEEHEVAQEWKAVLEMNEEHEVAKEWMSLYQK